MPGSSPKSLSSRRGTGIVRPNGIERAGLRRCTHAEPHRLKGKGQQKHLYTKIYRHREATYSGNERQPRLDDRRKRDGGVFVTGSVVPHRLTVKIRKVKFALRRSASVFRGSKAETRVIAYRPVESPRSVCLVVYPF